jgi:hypothetical protein
MKALKFLVAACSLSAAVAYAQAPSPAEANTQQVAQANTARAAQQDDHRTAGRTARMTSEQCVGPVSFCSIYFGS